MKFQPAIPTRGSKVPAGPEWLHELKYDGFRVIVHLVSKHRDRSYRGGRCAHWVKVKNPTSPAMKRAAEAEWR